jgi:glutamyl-tRNA synthetase
MPSLPLHVQLWTAFGWEQPQYAHLPVLLNPNGKGKLSKRHAGFTQDGRRVLVLAQEFREAGYLPEALVNFLTNIGWNFGDEREVFTVQEAIARFNLEHVNPADSIYPIEKLDWLNGVYIRELPIEDLARRLREPLETAGFAVDDQLLVKVAPLVQTRLKTLNDVVEIAGFFFREPFEPAPSAQLIQKKMDAAATQSALARAAERLAALDDFTHDGLEPAMRALAEQLGLSASQLFGTLRVAVTGQQVATPLFETMEILGRDTVLARVAAAAASLAD